MKNYSKEEIKRKLQKAYDNDKGRNVTIKIQVVNHYSNGTFKCNCCGESNFRKLGIDHIDGNGRQHRDELGIQAGYSFWRWLINNGYPEGYQILCGRCNIIKGKGPRCTCEKSKVIPLILN